VVLVLVDGGQYSGTGFVIADGEVITNRHVVAGAREIELHFHDERVESVDVESVLADSVRDLAFIKVDTGDAPPIAFGDDDALRRGQKLITVGFPGPRAAEDDIPQATITDGIFSAPKAFEGEYWLLVSIPGNPGNSGGPVADVCGTVYGVLTAVFPDSENQTLVVPETDADAFIQRARLGQGDDITSDREDFSVPSSVEDALRNANLTPGDFDGEFSMISEKFTGGANVPGYDIGPCGETIGIFSTFGNDDPQVSAEGASVLASASSGVFTFPTVDSAQRCFTEASELFSQREFIDDVAASLNEESEAQVRIDQVDPTAIAGPGTFDQEAALLVTGTFLYPDGSTANVEVVAVGFREGTEAGLLVAYFLPTRDLGVVNDLANTLVDKMAQAFSE
jgi:hypothetical protein